MLAPPDPSLISAKAGGWKLWQLGTGTHGNTNRGAGSVRP